VPSPSSRSSSVGARAPVRGPDGEGDGRGDQGPPVGPADERRPRAVARRAHHEGRPLGLLRVRRPSARPAPARPSLHDEALPGGPRGELLLPEGRAQGHACLDPDPHLPDVAARGEGRVSPRRLPARERRARAALDGADALHRHERVVLTRRPAGPARLRALRPRPARRRLPRRRPGRAPDPRPDGRARPGRAREDERRGRDPRRRADRPPLDLRGHVRVRRAGVAAARGAPSRPRHDRVAQAQAPRRPRRPPPERLGQDDRVGLLGPPATRRARLDAARLGRADRGPPATRLHDGRRARARRAARRPVRAGAPRAPSARARQPAPRSVGQKARTARAGGRRRTCGQSPHVLGTASGALARL